VQLGADAAVRVLHAFRLIGEPRLDRAAFANKVHALFHDAAVCGTLPPVSFKDPLETS
jgi:hypothetical protein